MCCPALPSEKLTASVNPCCLKLWGHHYYFIFYFYIIQAELQKPFCFSHHKLLLWNVEIMWETFYEMYAILFILSMQWKQQTNFWTGINLNQLQVNHIASFHANIPLDKKDRGHSNGTRMRGPQRRKMGFGENEKSFWKRTIAELMKKCQTLLASLTQISYIKKSEFLHLLKIIRNMGSEVWSGYKSQHYHLLTKVFLDLASFYDRDW